MRVDRRSLQWLSMFLLVGTMAATAMAGDVVWHEDYNKAKQVAAEEKKDLLVVFSGSDWCTWCIKLDKEVFHQEAFQKNAAKKFVFVMADFPHGKEQTPELKAQNERLKQDFTEQGAFKGLFPTVILADANGKAYAQTGYVEGGPTAYVPHLDFLQRARPMEDPGSTWFEDFEVAKAKAAHHQKDLLINFSGSDWCSFCIRLDREVFDKEAFKKAAPEDFVLVKLDFPQRTQQAPKIRAQNQKLAQVFSVKYGLQGYPSVYLADARGIPYAMTGYERGGPDNYVKILKDLKAKKAARAQN